MGMLALLCFLPVLAYGKNYFTASVFEHRPRHDKTLSPKEIISANLHYYETAAKLAAGKGADIILFNEYGLFPPNKNRDVFKTFMEHVPDPKKYRYNPCENKDSTFILTSLSCLAKTNNIYVVANMGDIQPCHGTCDSQVGDCDTCPDDGVFMYNTDVAFDNHGNLLARYHKMYPYFENVNIEENQYITFDTPFGKFGLIVCFDSVFQSALILARDFGVDTILFPTFWFDDIVPLNAVEWQESWAIANQVNFLAANSQTPGNGSLGSGIYSKVSGALVYTYEPDGESKLLVANVPLSDKDPESGLKPSVTVVKENSVYPKTETGDRFPLYGYNPVAGPAADPYLDYRVFKHQMENYTLVKLNTESCQVRSCSNDFCCTLSYTADSMTEDYYLAAFNGLNNVRGYYHWCEQSCLLLRCDPFFDQPCVAQPSRAQTVFKSLNLSATVEAQAVYPTVSKDKFRLAKREWKLIREDNTFTLEFKSDSNVPLLKAGFLARCYHRDPKHVPFYKF